MDPPVGWSCRRTLFNYDVWPVESPPFLQFKRDRAGEFFVASSASLPVLAIVIPINVIAESGVSRGLKELQCNEKKKYLVWQTRRRIYFSVFFFVVVSPSKEQAKFCSFFNFQRWNGNGDVEKRESYIKRIKDAVNGPRNFAFSHLMTAASWFTDNKSIWQLSILHQANHAVLLTVIIHIWPTYNA